MKYLLAFVLVGVATTALAQKDAPYIQEAITLMDGGHPDQAIPVLEDCLKKYPKSFMCQYELALAHLLHGAYAESAKLVHKLRKHKECNDLVYQLEGNALSYGGDPEAAIEVYEAGLKRFPNSGRLHLERGNIELHRDSVGQALYWYETGIQAEPAFPSNYYRAAKIFLEWTEEEVWGMIYGELFMNLERNSQRTIEMSNLLFQTYRNEIEFTDSGASVSFSKVATISIDDLTDLENFKLPFGIGAYEPTLAVAVATEDTLTPVSLNRIRHSFLEVYYGSLAGSTYPNVLFDYQKEIRDAGHFEAYNHWLVMQGDEDGFIAWHNQNEEQFDAFIDWFGEHGLELGEDRKFFRSQY